MRPALFIGFLIGTVMWAGGLGVCICLGLVTGLIAKMIPGHNPFFLHFLTYVLPCLSVVIGLIIARSTSRRLWDAD